MFQEMLWVVALLACWLLLCLNHSEIIALSGALLLGAFPDGYPRELCNNVYRQLLNCLLCLDIKIQHCSFAPKHDTFQTLHMKVILSLHREMHRALSLLPRQTTVVVQ